MACPNQRLHCDYHRTNIAAASEARKSDEISDRRSAVVAYNYGWNTESGCTYGPMNPIGDDDDAGAVYI
jgi:hypothetical protein